MHRFMLLAGLICLAASLAQAQTKTSGTMQCGKPNPQQVIAVGDIPNHSLGLSQIKCTWTKPMEIAGIQAKDGASTSFDDIRGNTSRTRGYHFTTMANGDALHVRYRGVSTLKDGVLENQKGMWHYTGGTGKFRGIKGGGTYQCQAAGEGISCDIEGSYELPK